MIIPVKCFTCGKVLGDKYRHYTQEVRKLKSEEDMDIESVIYLSSDNIKKTPEGEVMDELGLLRYCCRTHMLAHISLINLI